MLSYANERPDDQTSRQGLPGTPSPEESHGALRGAWHLAGSPQAAVVLMSALAVALVAATLYEKSADAASARRLFYHAWWFHALLGLIGLNILLAVLRRIPFKTSHIGFLVTHLALLLILVGAALNGLGAIEGTVVLKDGEMTDAMQVEEDEVCVSDSSGSVSIFAGDEYGRRSFTPGEVLAELPSGAHVAFLDCFANSRTVEHLINDPDAPRNPAVAVSLCDSEDGFRASFRLAADRSGGTYSPQRVYRDYDVLLTVAETREELERLLADPGSRPMRLTFLFPDDLRIYAVPLQGNIGKDVGIEGKGIIVRILEYMPNARESEGGYVNDPDAPRNPAVKYRLADAEGHRHESTLLASRPAMLMASETGAPWAFAHAIFSGTGHRPRFLMIQGPDEKLYFSLAASDGSVKSGEVEIGKSYPLEFQNLEIETVEYLSHARVKPRTEPAPVSGCDDTPCVVLRLETSSGDQMVAVAYGGVEKTVLADGGEVEIAYRGKRKRLPFTLTLVESRPLAYPGSNRLMGFESEVLAREGPNGEPVGKTVRVNEPLLIAGYKVFQATPDDWRGGGASRFKIALDPGVNVIYIGCAALIAGLIITFYVRSSAKVRQARGSDSPSLVSLVVRNADQ